MLSRPLRLRGNTIRTLSGALLLLVGVAHGFDVELAPTTIPGFFYNPDYGAVFVASDTNNLHRMQEAGIMCDGTLTLAFGQSSAPDTLWGEDVLSYMGGFRKMAKRTRLLRLGRGRQEQGLLVDIDLYVYEAEGEVIDECLPLDRPNFVVDEGRIVPKRRNPVRPQIAGIRRVRLYTGKVKPAMDRRLPWGEDFELEPTLEPNTYHLPGLCEVTVPTLNVDTACVQAAWTEYQATATLAVRFTTTGRLDSVYLQLSSGQAWLDSALLSHGRRVGLKRFAGAQLDARPRVEIEYVYTQRAFMRGVKTERYSWGVETKRLSWCDVNRVRLTAE